MPQKIKILQINANRSRLVMDEVMAAVRHLGCQVVAVSEPNLTSLERCDYSLDRTGGAAIIDVEGVLGSASVVSCDGFVIAASAELLIVSGYFSPNISMEEYVAMLDELNSQIRSTEAKKVIVLGDFNAKNQAWGGDLTDRRGILLQEVMRGLDLMCF